MSFKKSLTKKTLVSAAVLILIGGVSYRYIFPAKTAPKLIAATRGDISQEVIVTGTTKPVNNLSLAFETTGRISRVSADVGDRVNPEQTLAELDSTELRAQLRQAQANTDAAQAKLAELKRGARSEDIRVAQTALDKAQQDLLNNYSGVINALSDAYAKADDALRNQVSALFINAETANPQLSYSSGDSQAQIDALNLRLQAGTELNAWKSELGILGSTSSASALDQALQNAQSHLNVTRTFINKLMDTLTTPNSLSAATITSYKTSITTARSQLNTATANINSQWQTIAAQKIVVRQKSDELALKLAGSSTEEINAQTAQVAQAQAQIEVIQAQIQKTILRSPIKGTVTKQDAKVGQIVSPNVVVTSVISQDNLQIESNVPEVDIGKIAVKNPISITFDALPGEKFRGRVIAIDPAQTIIDGVVNFKITIAFASIDPRFKSGLTVNLSIETAKKSNVLILPQLAIIENDRGTFVKKPENGTFKEYPLKLGIRSSNGNVEIISGVSDGEKVLNVGLKTTQ